MLTTGREGDGVVADTRQQRLKRNGQAVRGIVGGLQLGQQQQVIEQVLHAHGLLLHLLQRPQPARIHPFGVVGESFQIAGDHRQGGAQLVGHVGDEVLAHLLQLMHAGHVTHQHQVLAVAIQSDLDLQAHALVDRRRQLQRLAVILFGKVFLEARMTHEVADGLTTVLGCLQTQELLGGDVPPFQVAIAVEHDDGVAQGRGGLLHTVDHRLQAPTGTLIAALQVIDAVEHLAPQAMAIGRRFIGLLALQPFLQAQQLPESPAQITGQTDDQRPGVLAAEHAGQQTHTEQKKQAAHQAATPLLFHAESLLQSTTGPGAWHQSPKRRNGTAEERSLQGADHPRPASAVTT